MNDEVLHLTLHNPDRVPDQARAAVLSTLLPFCTAQFQNGVERISITAQPEEDAKTVQQDRFYHGVILRQIAEQAVVEGQRYTEDAWHELFKRRFLPRVTKRVYVAGKKRPIVTTTIGTTKGIGVRKMGKFLDEIIAFAQTDLGVVFSLIRWEDYRQ